MRRAPESLDELIDRVAADLTRPPRNAAPAARVLARLHRRRLTPRTAVPLLAAAAAIVIALRLLPGPAPTPAPMLEPANRAAVATGAHDVSVTPAAPDVEAAAVLARAVTVGVRAEPGRPSLDPGPAIPALAAPGSLLVADLAVDALDVPAVVVDRLDLATIAIDDLSDILDSKEQP